MNLLEESRASVDTIVRNLNQAGATFHWAAVRRRAIQELTSASPAVYHAAICRAVDAAVTAKERGPSRFTPEPRKSFHQRKDMVAAFYPAARYA